MGNIARFDFAEVNTILQLYIKIRHNIASFVIVL